MNENIDFIVLEHDDGAGCALIVATVEGAVPAIDGYNTPYVVAKGYDHAARDWEDCRLFGSSLGKSLTVQYTGEEDIAPALREVRAYCKDAAEKRDPCLISAMAQASAAKSATAEGEAGGKKL